MRETRHDSNPNGSEGLSRRDWLTTSAVAAGLLAFESNLEAGEKKKDVFNTREIKESRRELANNAQSTIERLKALGYKLNIERTLSSLNTWELANNRNDDGLKEIKTPKPSREDKKEKVPEKMVKAGNELVGILTTTLTEQSKAGDYFLSNNIPPTETGDYFSSENKTQVQTPTHLSL